MILSLLFGSSLTRRPRRRWQQGQSQWTPFFVLMHTNKFPWGANWLVGLEPNRHQHKMLFKRQGAVTVSHNTTRQVADMTKDASPSHTLTNITWNDPCWGDGARELLRVFGNKTSFSLVYINVQHQEDKKALCCISALKSGWMPTSGNVPVFTAVIKMSAFADGLRQAICQTILD